MSRLTALFVLIALHSPAREARHVGLCSLPYCKCTPEPHASWTTVNCTVPHDQRLDILDGELDDSTTNLEVQGAEAVMFGENSLSRLKDLRHLRVSDTKLVLMRQFTALNLNVISAYLEIDNCNVLRFEERTFSFIKGPLSVSINNCDSVSIEGEAFSWLLTLKLTNIRQLDIGPGAFTLDPTAANVGELGPGMTIEMKNLTVPEFAAQTFGSSAAAVTMVSVEVRAIRTDAFPANTYNVVEATNTSIHLIEGEAFAQKSLVNHLRFEGCKVHQLASRAIKSAIAKLNISRSRFDKIQSGAINATVATVVILDTKFHNFMERGFELVSWNKFQMERNSFDDLVANAIVAPGLSIHELIFSENEIEKAHADSLKFIGDAHAAAPTNVVYKNNYYGQACHCNISTWLTGVLGVDSVDQYESESYCTVDEFFARCFNVPEQNMLVEKFFSSVCGAASTIQCEAFKIKGEGAEPEIKNPRFPHKYEDDEEGLTDRNKKVIGIVLVTCLGCVLIALLISLIRWMRRQGYCLKIKNLFFTCSSCGTVCDRYCACGGNNGLDNARSISQMSVNEYSERHRLNEPRVQDIVQESTVPELYTEQIMPVEDKTTQTLPEELTKELLENLKEKLEDPENYVEAREMIEHLYELIKIEENCNSNTSTALKKEENIYELPFQNTAPRIGKNKKKMISVGTRTPSLDKLLPLSPYERQTALAHEYFEPKDFAVHLYAEIVNSDKEKKTLMSAMPDLVGDQPIPRGPYLRAVREKRYPTPCSPTFINTPSKLSSSPQPGSTIRSNKSITSNSSGKMANRPLPEKPPVLDPGEGTSFKLGGV